MLVAAIATDGLPIIGQEQSWSDIDVILLLAKRAEELGVERVDFNGELIFQDGHPSLIGLY